MSGIQDILYGENGRIRATLRMLPTVPLYILSVLAATIGFSVLGAPMDSMGVYAARLGIGALLFSGVFVFWSKRVDRRPFQDYGIETDSSVITNFLIGLVVVISAFAVWAGVSSVAGASELTLVMGYNGGAFVPAAILFAIGTVFGALSQDLLYLGLISTNTIEGLGSRISSTSGAVAGGAVVTSVVFVGYHFLLGIGVAGFLPPAEAAVSLVASIFFLIAVYLYSGSLAMAVGSHTALNAVQGMVFVNEAARGATPFPTPTIFAVDGTLLPGVLGTPPIAEAVIAFVLLFGGLRLVQGSAEVEETVSQFQIGSD